MPLILLDPASLFFVPHMVDNINTLQFFHIAGCNFVSMSKCLDEVNN